MADAASATAVTESALEAVVHDLSVTSISNATVIPVRSTRGRKRKAVAVLTPEPPRPQPWLLKKSNQP